MSPRSDVGINYFCEKPLTLPSARYGASVVVLDELADVTGALSGRVKADDLVG